MREEASTDVTNVAKSMPEYQKMACDLAAAGWEEFAKAQYTGDTAKEDAARLVLERAVGICRSLGTPTACPDRHPWCPCR